MFKLPTKRACSFIMAMILSIGVIAGSFAPRKAYAAYAQSMIQCTINTGTWEVMAGAVTGISGSVAMLTYEDAIEYRRIGGILDLMVNTAYPSLVKDFLDDQPHAGGGNAKRNLILTFPGNVSEGISRTSATDSDIRRTQIIRNQLVFSLNDAFIWLKGKNGVYKPDGDTMESKIADYESDMNSFLSLFTGSNSSYGPFNIYYYGTSPNKFQDLSQRDFPDAVTWFTDYVCVENVETRETRYFLFRMPKGYRDVPSDGRPNPNVPQTLGLAKTSDYDAVFIHWGHLAVEAFINYRITNDQLRVSPDEVYNGSNSSFSEMITDFAINVIDSISNILGLWSLDELVFNSGTRGSSTYADGVFPSSWQPFIWAFFFIAEIVALIMIIYAILWNVGRRLRSTVNPIMRASAMDQLKTLIICAVILGLLPIIYKILMNVSYHATGIFSEVLGDVSAKEKFGALGSSAGGIGGVVISAFYLGIMVYFNVFYLVRGLSVAFLMIIGPMAIASMAINVEKRQLTVAWAEEILSQILVQPIQALFLSFVLILPTSPARKIESIILVYSLIPLTKIAKKVIFPRGGDGLVEIAEKGKATGSRFASKVGGTAIAVGAGALIGAGGAIGSMIAGRNSEEPASTNNSSDNPDGANNNSGNSTNSSNTANSSNGSSNSSAGNNSDYNSENNTGSTFNGGETFGGNGGGNEASNGEPEVVPGTMTSSTSGSAEAAQSQDASLKDIGIRAAMGAGAIALGALGGATDIFNKRVFKMNSPNGGMVTQFSRKLGSRVLAKRPSTTPEASVPVDAPETPVMAPETPVEEPTPSFSFNPNGFDAGQYHVAMETENTHNVFTKEDSPVEKTDLGNGSSVYSVDRENLRDVGVASIKHDKGGSNNYSTTSTVSYVPNQVSAADNAKLNHIYDIFKNGTDKQKQQLRDLGIKNVTTTEKNNGSISKVNVTFDNKKAQTNFGLNLSSREITSSTPSFVPNISDRGFEVPKPDPADSQPQPMPAQSDTQSQPTESHTEDIQHNTPPADPSI